MNHPVFQEFSRLLLTSPGGMACGQHCFGIAATNHLAMANFATCSAEELQQLAAALSDAERQSLREALQLLEA